MTEAPLVPLGGPEIVVLGLGGLLLTVQFFAMAIPANLELGTSKTLGNRDQPLQLSTRTGRLHRALGNMQESLLLYAVAALTVTLLGAGTGFTAACAWVWLIARAAYVPCYAFGLVPWRSVVFAVGNAAAVLMILAALL